MVISAGPGRRIVLMKQILISIQNTFRRITDSRSEKGMTLAEVLVAVAITGTLVTMLLTSLSTGSRAVGTMYESSTAEGIAQSQLEYTRSQSYMTAPATYDSITSLPPHFTVSSEASAIDGRDGNIQKITVTVYRDSEPVLIKEDFKVNR